METKAVVKVTQVGGMTCWSIDDDHGLDEIQPLVPEYFTDLHAQSDEFRREPTKRDRILLPLDPAVWDAA